MHSINITHNGSNRQRDEDDDYFNEAIKSNERPLVDESKYYSSPKNNVVEKDQRDDIDEIESSNETNKDIEAHTVILTDNFFLPAASKEEPKKDEEVPEYEYEYEYVEETEEPPPEDLKAEPTPVPAKEEDQIAETETPEIITETEATIATTKSNSSEAIEVPPNDEEPGNTTESWVVVASVQTSRSVSGARFLPFPQVKQEEKKAPITELDTLLKTSEEKSQEQDQEAVDSTQEPVPETTIIETTTVKSVPTTTVSTESINDKLDSIQSELSSGVLSGQFPVLKEMTTEEATKPSAPFIRKFSPKAKLSTAEPSTTEPTSTSTTTTVRSSTESSIAKKQITIQDDLTGLLPADFKPRYTGYKSNKKTTTTTTTTTTEAQPPSSAEVKVRNVNNTRSFFKNDAPAQDVQAADSKIKIEDDISKFLPKDYTTEKSKLKVLDDVSKFLPPGYKASSSEKPVIKVVDDVSKFLPPGFKAPADETPPAVIPLKIDDISKFLPPGYKPETTTRKSVVVPAEDTLSKFLPPGYKLKPAKKPEPEPQEEEEEEEEKPDDKFAEILKKIQFKEVSDLVPADFKPQQKAEVTPPTTTTAKPGGLVFPTRPGGNKEAGAKDQYKRPKGPPPPKIDIKKGGVTR